MPKPPPPLSGRPVTRRRALKLSFAFSAGALLHRAAAEEKKDKALADPGPPSPPPAALPDDRHLMIWGDWGATGDRKAQTAVAGGMARYTRALGTTPVAQLLLGDNFYGSFKGGVDSPRWKEQFEDMYPADVLPGPCYAALGNHDYDDAPGTKLVAELQYSRTHPGTRWSMPANWYSFTVPDLSGQPLVHGIVLDSNYKNRLISLSAGERVEQLKWLEEELALPRLAPWVVVMAHHPLYTQGNHGDNKALIADWDGIFRKHRVPLYLAGHDHDLQHLEFDGHPTSFVISGGGGARARHSEMDKAPKRPVPFAKAVYGFSHLQVNRDRFILRHLDANGSQIHAFTKLLAGGMTPLA